MVAAIKYAADKGARVINLSYTGVHMQAIADAAHYAAKRGAVVFMAAGNDGTLHENWRNWNWLVAVGSVDAEGGVSDFSSRGSFVDFVAPGRRMVTTLPDDVYGTWSGTSFASPLAASVASLMLTANPELSAGQVIRILRATAMDVGAEGVDVDSGYGLIDAAAAVDLAMATEGFWTAERQKVQVKWAINDLSRYEGLQLSSGLLSPVGIIAEEPYEVSSVPEPAVLALMLVGTTMVRLRRSAPA
jgi:subtilisin family serine protease